MAQVVLKDVNKVYPNGYHAIIDLNLDIADGEFLVLVGPSGCGKSTALRMVAGLEEISGGEMYIGDRMVNDVHPKDRDIAMVFQNYALYPHMTVADNIGFALKLAKVPKPEIEERVRKAAAVLDLTENLDRKPGQLSGGQRQRVAMGRAIVRQPKAFLMDEPLSNLDAKLRVQMRAEIAGLQRDLGVTTLYVTHDQVEAMTMGDRVAVLKRGWLQQVDSPQNLYDKPANVFVAGFIGSPSMNLMASRIEGAGSDLKVHIGSNTLDLDAALVAANPGLADFVGKDIVVGVRPEDLADAELATSPVPQGRTITSETTLVEALGSEIIVHFPLDAEPFAIMDAEFEGEDAVEQAKDDQGRTIYVARLSPRSQARMGARLTLNVDTSRMHFFDPQTGLAISRLMDDEATGVKLGRLVRRARNKSSETSLGLRSRARSAWRGGDNNQSPRIGRDSAPGSGSAEDSSLDDSIVVDIELSDALARAEYAEAENERLRSELERKEDILAEAGIALRTARLALRDHLRITQR